MSLLLRELKFAYASLKRAREFSAAIVVTMSLSLGTLICLFTLNYLLLLSPLPYKDQDRLYASQQVLQHNGEVILQAQTYPGLVKWYKEQDVFERVSLISYQQQQFADLSNEPIVNVAFTTSGFFELTAAPIAFGRTFSSTEDLNTFNPVALISYKTWQSLFFGDQDIIGKQIHLNNISYKVIGVIDQSFAEPELYEVSRETQIWLPWDFNPDDEKQVWGRYYTHHMLLGKLNSDLSKEQAEQKLSVLSNDGLEEYATKEQSLKGYKLDSKLIKFEELILGDSSSVSLIMLAAALSLVLIACVNITNLFLARAAQKQRQIAIKAALGAKLKHLFTSMFAESFLLMFISTILALVVSFIEFRLIAEYAQGELPRLEQLGISIASIIFSILLCFLLAGLFAFLSCTFVNYKSLQNTLQSSGKGSGQQTSKFTRNLLIASQVALAGVLLVVNIDLFKGSLDNINKPLGFSHEQRYSLSLNGEKLKLNGKERRELMGQLKNELLAMPQIINVSMSSSDPMDVEGGSGFHAGSEISQSGALIKWVDNDYLTLSEFKFVAGRNFTKSEVLDRAKVFVISQSMAEQFYSGGSAVGEKLYYADDETKTPYKVIGVVEDVFNPMDPQRNIVLNPSLPWPFHFMIETNQGAINKIQLLNTIRNINRQFSIFKFESMEEKYTRSLARDFAIVSVTAFLAILSLLLAGIGIYGVLSFNIKMRSNELGIRIAIGAKPNRILSMVLFDTATPLIFGLLSSFVILFVSYFFGSEEIKYFLNVDASSVTLSSFVILVTTVFACYLSLITIIKKQPVFALKYNE